MSARGRLLSLNTYHYRRGGSDAVYFDHAELFARHGWDTAFFAMQHPDNQPSRWEPYFVDELEFGGDYGLRDKLVMAGKVIYSLEARRKLSALLDDWRPDIGHAHCVYHHLSPSVLTLLHSRGIPTVMTAHDLKLACPAYKMQNGGGVCEKCKNGNLIHVALNRCIHDSLAVSSLVMVESAIHKLFRLYRRSLDRVIVPSRFYGAKLEQWGWPSEQIAYVPNFIDVDAYTPDYDGGDYVLYFGRLAAAKGVDTLIQAATQAQVKLRIAGTGPQERELRELAARQADNVEFLGYCAGDRLHALIRGARAVVLPSQWYENAPISILEAYASGKILVGARIGGIPEMIVEGETGFLFESGHAAELADRLRSVIKLDNATVREMGKQARQFLVSRFTPAHYLRNMLELYGRLGVPV